MVITITRELAKEGGLTRYFTGIPCKKGHVTERLTSSRECVGCKQARELKKYENGIIKDYKRRHYMANRGGKIEKQKEYTERRKPEYLKYLASWRAENKQKIRQYMKDNSGLFAHHAAKRRKYIIKATPKWADMQKIMIYYDMAALLTQETDVVHHVDHIIPLRGKNVCGLHCEYNLQVLTRVDNLSKGNKHTID